MDSLSLPLETWDSIFPFHILLDQDLRILQIGSALQRVYPDCGVQTEFETFFKIARPSHLEISFENLKAYTHYLFVLENPDRSLKLRAQLLVLESPNRLLFLASPWFTDRNELKEMGLNLRDLPLHNVAVDFLTLLQLQKSALKEAQEMAEHLSAQQAELQKSNQALALANEAKTDFIANLSHEIRTPMHAIVGMSELMGQTELDPEQKNYLTSIWSGSQSLLHLMNDLLDISKIEVNQVDIANITFDPLKVCQQAFQILHARIQEKGLAFHLKCQSDAEIQAIGDPNRIRQILLNLLGNALKFTQQGKIELILDITLTPGDRVALCFEVNDSGMGISEEKQAVIFDKFVQVHDQSKLVGGLGLGLNISQRLAQAMQGHISLSSSEGIGSSFRLNLNLPLAQNLIKPVFQMYQPTLKSKNELSILLCDDTPEIRLLTKKWLESDGYHVDAVSNGQEAVAKAASYQYDLILMDLQMPEIDGLKATQLIREMSLEQATQRIPILAFTAHAIESYRHQAYANGMDDFITKPIQKNALLEKIEQNLQKRFYILIVDDEPLNHQICLHYLKSYSQFHCLHAYTHQEALDCLQNYPVTLVLLDLNLADSSGLAIVQQIRQQLRYQKTPIIAVTAYAGEELKQKCLAAGCNDYLAKPFQEDDLVQTLSQHLNYDFESSLAKQAAEPHE